MSIPLPITHSPETLDPQSAAAHLPRLRRFARSLCGSSQLAEDLTQETYVRVLARPRRVYEDSEFPYLARTLRNVFLDHWRAEQRKPPVGLLDQDLPSARAQRFFTLSIVRPMRRATSGWPSPSR